MLMNVFTPEQPQDLAFMQQALRLAESARYRTSPNPRVGCVLVNNGVVVGSGATQSVGGDHAEVDAIKNAKLLGHNTQGATAYVTLEPCNHTGRTGPCTDALLAAGVARVVVAIIDPNPQNNTQNNTQNNPQNNTLTAAGLKKLADADVAVTLGVCAKEAAELNTGFIKRMVTGLPWVRLKVATSIDGFVALPNGNSQWLTGEAARADGHHWRASSCAVVTGIGTVLADNPSLDVRHVATTRQPLRIVLDTHLRTPLDTKLFAVKSPLLFVHASVDANKLATFAAAGAQLQALPMLGDSLDLSAFVRWAGQQGLNELHIEAGSAINGALLNAGLVDEVLLYQAPVLLGVGMPWAKLNQEFKTVGDAPRLLLQSATQLGADARLVLHTANTFNVLGK